MSRIGLRNAQRFFALALLLLPGFSLGADPSTDAVQSASPSGQESLQVLAQVRQAGPGRTLSFEERVWCQRRIEEVYWRHRIWPDDNPGAKPRLDERLPDDVIRERVSAYLDKTAALEIFWSRPLTGEQLQAEVARMGRRTKKPAVLAELYAALDNDPLLVAECLARPMLADRLARSLYARD